MNRGKVNMIKCSFSSILITVLLITSNSNYVKCRHMPIRMLFQRFQQQQDEVPAHGIGRQATGSQSEAHSSALTNAVNIAGVPITNTVSGSHAASTSSGHSGNFLEHFGLGGYGLDVGLASDKIGSGISASHVPGQQLGLHIGGLNLGLTNKGGLFGSQNTQTQTGATAAATGQGAQSSSQSNTQSNSISGLGGLINVQNTLSNSQAQAYSQDGIASANSGANSLAAAQTASVPNIASPSGQSNFQQPGIGGIFNSFPINPFGHFGSVQPIQQYPQQQFGYQQQYPSQQYPIQQYPVQQYPAQQYPSYQQFPNQQFSNQQFPSQQFSHQQFPHQQFPNQQVYGQPLSPFQGNFGSQRPSFNAPGLNNYNNQQPTVQPNIQQNQGLDSSFLDVLKENENTVNIPAPNNQIGSTGPQLTQGGLQNTFPTNPQQNIPQTNVAENTLPTTQNSVDNDAPGAEFGLDVRIDEDEVKSKNVTKSKKVKRSANPRNRHHHHHGPPPPQPGFGFPGQSFNAYPQYQQQNANSNGFAQNQNPFTNQNAGSNTFSQFNQSPLGQFQNTGGSSIGSNLANNGLSGQVSAANTDQQSYLTAQGFGQKNNGQSQSANFDQFGNLQTSNANTGTQFTKGSDGQQNQANGASNAHLQNQYGTSDSGSQTLSEDFVGPNGEKGSKTSSSAFSSNVNNGYPQRSKRATAQDTVSFPKDGDAKPIATLENKPATVEGKKEPVNGTDLESRFGFGFGFPGQQMNVFPQYQQQNTNSNGLAQNQNPFFNQNAGSNTYSQNNQNPFGQFQNTGGSSIGSNLANNGLSGQVSAANTDQQNYLTAQGFGQKNNGQSQSANFDQFGNLQTSNANTGTQLTKGPDGQRNQANGASNAHLQNQYGTSDSGSQTISEDFEGPNGEKGSKASSSAFSSNVNNGNGNVGNFGDANNYYGFPQRFKRATSEDAVSFPKEGDMKSVAAPENKQPTVEGEKETANGTELDSRFGGPFRGIIREVVGGLLGRQGPYNQGPFNQGDYYPQQGNFYNQAPGLYPQQGNIYNQAPVPYPQQGNYYNQGPEYNSQQTYPLQPNLEDLRYKRAISEDAVSFPREEDVKSVTTNKNKTSTVEGEKEGANGTELDSRFGGPFGGIVRQVVGGLLGRQPQGPFNQGGYYPQQGNFYNQAPGFYPQQGSVYNQAPGFYPQQGNYYNQGPGYYPQQSYPLQPGFGGPRFRRAAQGALVFPDDEDEKNVITPIPVKATNAADTAVSTGAAVEKTEGEQNSTDLESRFGFHGRRPLGGAIREAIGELLGIPNQYENDRQYGRPPPFGRPPSHYGGSPYASEHYHPRPDYPTHHHHHHHAPHYPNHNQPPAYPLQPTPEQPQYNHQPQHNQQPQYNQQPGVNYQQPINQQTNTNGAAQSQNQNAISNQNSASNTHSSNVNNAQGNFQNTGGSSISSNIANNGQSGQVSSSNTEQQSSHTAHGSEEKNTGQSQSANFDQNGNLGTSAANTGTHHTVGPDGERNQATGAANSHQQTQNGVSDSTSQTNAETFNQNGVMGNKASGQSTSAFQGADGSVLTANSGSETQTFEGPNGIKGTSSSSHSSSQNIGNGFGGNVGTSSSSGSGTGFGGAQTYSNAGGYNTLPFGGSGAQTNAFSGSNNFGSNAGANAGSNTYSNYNRPVQTSPFIFS